MSQGYIRGGQLGGRAFKPEIALSHEAGVKADLFDHTLRANLSVYQVKYSDLQQIGLLPGAGPNGGGLTVVFSVGDTKVKGFELETTWVTPIPGLTLNASAALTDFRYVRANPQYLLFTGLTFGQLLTPSPKWTGNLAMNYEGPELNWGGRLSARIDGNSYWDKYLTHSFRSAAQREYLHVDDRYVVNARLAITDIPLGRSEGEVAIWARNLFDADGAVGVTFIGYSSANYEQQRTFGVDLMLRF